MIITEGTYVDKAEGVIKKLATKIDKKGRPNELVTTSKLRNLLAMTSDIYNEVLSLQTDQLDERLSGRIEYLRIRYIYEAGREPKVKELITEAQIPEIIKEIKGSKKNFLLFNHYMEALVAFRKFHGGKDD